VDIMPGINFVGWLIGLAGLGACGVAIGPAHKSDNPESAPGQGSGSELEITSPAFNALITVPVHGSYLFTGTCSSGTSNENSLHITPGQNVQVIEGKCEDGILSIELLLTGLNSLNFYDRVIEVHTEEPGGLSSEVLNYKVRAYGSCPPNYVGVAQHNTLGTQGFCVAKFDMKAVESNPVGSAPRAANLANGGDGEISPYDESLYAEPRPDGTPWTQVNLRDAVLQCDKLNSSVGGTGPYQLISNVQWQALASAIESVPKNWSLLEVGEGVLAHGHSDNTTDAEAINNGLRSSARNRLAAMSTAGLYSTGTFYDWDFADLQEEFSAGYRGTGNSASDAVGSGWEQRRTHYLPNGELVWDVSGNVWSWVRFTELEGALDTGLGGNTELTFNSRLLPLQPNISSVMRDTNSSALFSDLGAATGVLLSSWFKSFIEYATSPRGFGIGGVLNRQNVSGYALQRGGAANRGADAGIFSGNMFDSGTTANSIISFRCVYNP
jgi:hypothetical protein